MNASLLVIIFASFTCNYVAETAVIVPTKGDVWPNPYNQTIRSSYYVLLPNKFKFNVIKNDCPLLEQALQRYWHLIAKTSLPKDVRFKKKMWSHDDHFDGFIDALAIVLETPCSGNEYPHFEMDEQYYLKVDNATFLLEANTVWGIIRGLETFSQLVHRFDYDDSMLIINATVIHDFPRFKHRGLLLDTSRHYLPVNSILKTLEAMSFNKLNVFHWHITDDQSFPFQSTTFPELSENGAYHPRRMIYSVDDVQKIVEHARVRGIRVLPEFDTPGHTLSWGEGVPELLTECYGKLSGQRGPMNPTRDFLYKFLKQFFSEIRQRFPDKYLHLGGDEVDFDCWQSNPDIGNFMIANNMTGDYKALESYFVQKLVNIADTLKAESIVWEEVFDNGVKIPKTTLVHIWKDSYQSMLYRVTRDGYKALFSSCWYLDHLSSGGDWRKFYLCDPYDFSGTDKQKKLILGGEACMWGEVVNEFNLESRVWPRASAVAEKLWSSNRNLLLTEVAKRLEEHTCRMNRRGISAQPPNGPGVCL